MCQKYQPGQVVAKRAERIGGGLETGHQKDCPLRQDDVVAEARVHLRALLGRALQLHEAGHEVGVVGGGALWK